MSAERRWKQRIAPYSRVYAHGLIRLTTHLRTLTDDQVRDLLTAAHQPTPTNCDWVTYDTAALLRPAAREEARRRGLVTEYTP